MTAAAIQLVKRLRRAFPTITIMMNRGYALLPEVGGDIDIALGESVYGTYDFERRAYRAVSAQEYRAQVLQLKLAKKINPRLRICSLDYWDPTDRDGIRRVYRAERANGFDPYVATIGLDRLMKGAALIRILLLGFVAGFHAGAASAPLRLVTRLSSAQILRFRAKPAVVVDEILPDRLRVAAFSRL